jgi:hypothetical protein
MPMKATDRLKLAGKELIRGNIGNALKSVLVDSFSSTDRLEGRNGFWFFDAGGRGQDIHFDYTGNDSSLTAYRKCPPVTAIINRKAQAYINGKTWILNTQGKARDKVATGEVAQKVRALLNKPNPLQSQKQFEAQQYIYQQMRGFCIMLPIKPTGFGNIEAKRLWNLPPWMCEIRERRDVSIVDINSPKDLIESIHFVFGNTRTNLPLDDIYIFKDFTPSIDSLIIPDSRIRSLAQPINNIIGAYESRNVLINSRGPMYVISSNESDESGNIPISPVEKEELLAEFKSRYGLTRKQSLAIITNTNIKVDSVGFPTKDLMLFEEIEDDIMRICDSYTYPYQLLASSKNTTFANVNDAKKLLYQDATIPESESMYEQWNHFFDLEKYFLTLNKDYSHVPALQEDKVQEADARLKRNQALLIEFQNNQLTLNEWREKNGEDPVTGDFGTLYYFELVAKGIVFGKGNQLSVSMNSDQQQSGSTESNTNSNNG